MHLAPLIRDLALILGVAGLMSLLFQRIRQPVILGYIVAGMIVGPATEGLQTWADLGVIFLMFSLGLEFSFRKLARVGVSGGIVAGVEALILLPTGYIAGQLLGWSAMDSVFLGAMISVSSTTVIIKALDELKLKTHRFAELIFGALIAEDLIAILLLVALTTVAINNDFSAVALLSSSLRLILVVGGWFIAGYFVVPRFMKYAGRVGNNEMLTLLSLGLCLGLVVFASHFHYSTALGAFIMGSILAETSVLHRIEERMGPLRDLFGAIFFVSIGMRIDFGVLLQYRGTIIALCCLTIFGKVLTTTLGAILSGQTVKNSIRVGFGLSQIGEFSFILAGLGMSLKATSSFIFPVIVAVSLVTTFTTPYLMRYSGSAGEWVDKALPEKLRDFLNRYAVWSEERRTGVSRRKTSPVAFLRWFINGLTISVIFVLSAEVLLPYLETRAGATLLNSAFWAWLTAIVLSAPFIWGILSALQPRGTTTGEERRSTGPGVLLISRFFALLWIGGLSAEFFPGKNVAIATLAVVTLLFALGFRRLEIFYRWYEHRFISTFEKQEPRHRDPAAALKDLAPWDAHLVKIEVHPNAELVLKQLKDAELRTKRGVNVVAIQRGLDTIVAPKPVERILPRDVLVVLGTDEQVEAVKKDLEAPPTLSERSEETSTYELRNARLGSHSIFVGQSVRQSGIRERFSSMVVGIERDGRRNINPDSDLKMIEGDILWLVGEKAQLDSLFKHLNEARA